MVFSSEKSRTASDWTNLKGKSQNFARKISCRDHIFCKQRVVGKIQNETQNPMLEYEWREIIRRFRRSRRISHWFQSNRHRAQL